MKELDFDELDKAVNSLMSNVPKDTAVADAEPPTRTVELPETPAAPAAASLAVTTPANVPEVTAPVPDPPAVTPTEATAEEVTPAETIPVTATPRPAPAVPAARRGGRFMDVVHPSSDMKSTVPPRVSREGTTLAPAADISPSPAAPVTDVEPVVAEAPEVKNETSATDTTWPDPLDSASFSLPPEGEAPADEQEPLSSPFIAGTKVEKRPLGGATPAGDAVAQPDVEPETQAQSSEGAQLPPQPPQDEPLPAELDTTIMAVEETDHHEEAPAVVAPVVPTPMSTETPPVPSASAAVGAASIPQQYTESPSTGDQTNGAVFDTNTYHKPLEHPAKKKSGWLWVIWIVLILLVGAAGGAALYMMKIF